MTNTVPDLSDKEVENFCFHLHFIYKGKTKQRFAIVKNTRNICSTRKWKFYNVLQKRRIWVIADNVPDFSIKEICSVSIRRRLNNDPLYLKVLEKCIQPANEFLHHFAKNMHMSHGENRYRL